MRGEAAVSTIHELWISERGFSPASFLNRPGVDESRRSPERVEAGSPWPEPCLRFAAARFQGFALPANGFWLTGCSW